MTFFSWSDAPCFLQTLLDTYSLKRTLRQFTNTTAAHDSLSSTNQVFSELCDTIIRIDRMGYVERNSIQSFNLHTALN